MKKILLILGAALGAAAAFFAILQLAPTIAAALFRLPCAYNAPDNSIGIIGGADGPTSIYITSSPSSAVVGAVVAAAGIAATTLCITAARKVRK